MEDYELLVLKTAIVILEEWAECHEDPAWREHHQKAANMIYESIATDSIFNPL